MQAAAELDRVSLLALALEVCGSYALDPAGGETRYGLKPLTSVARLAAHCSKARGAKGLAKARWALRHAVDGAASPLETAFLIEALLPKGVGGHGFSRPTSNLDIEIPPDLRSPIDPRRRRGDVCWPEKMLAVELLGRGFHGDDDGSRVADSDRAATLEALGWHVIQVTSAQLYSEQASERVFEAVRRRLGIRRRAVAYDLADRRAALRGMLYEGDALRPWCER